MRRLIVGIILSLASFGLYAQQRTLRPPSPPQLFEQLQNQVNSSQNPDSLIEYYTTYALRNLRFEPDSSEATILKINGLQGLPESKIEAHASLIKARLYLMPYPDSALIFVGRSINLFNKLNEQKKIPGLLNLKSQIHRQLNNYLAAEDALLQAIEIVQEENFEYQDFELNTLLNALAGVYMRVGATDIAIERYVQMLEIETSKDRECRTRLNISNAYKTNNELDQAKAFLEPCIENSEVPTPIQIAVIKSMGNLEKLQGNFDERLFYMKRAVEMQETTRYRDITAFLFLAEAYFDKAEYAKADSILSLVNERDLRRTQPFTQIHLKILEAKLLIQNEEQKYALNTLDEALSIIERIPETPLKVEVLLLKSEIYKSMGDYRSAYETISKTQEINEIVKSRAKTYEEANSKVRFQMKAKNQELAQVTTELGTLKTRNALIIILLLMIGLYVFYRYRIHFLLREERTRNRIARDLHDDLSATLSSIHFFSEAVKREKITGKDSQKYLQLIDDSAVEAKEKINDIIWAIDPDNDDWEAFLTKCKRYASEMFESKNINYEINIDTTIELPQKIKARQDLWLIFKELVTNLIRHSNATDAWVSFISSKDQIILCVRDNGIGFNIKDYGEGHGVSNIEKRMNNISEMSTLNLESKPEKGTRWELIFNF